LIRQLCCHVKMKRAEARNIVFDYLEHFLT